jgi:hypothetical protein
MANIMTVVIPTLPPEGVSDLPSVKRYGDNALQKIEDFDMRGLFGKYIIHTYSSIEVSTFLKEQGYDMSKVYWQDLDGYGPTKIFSYKK